MVEGTPGPVMERRSLVDRLVLEPLLVTSDRRPLGWTPCLAIERASRRCAQVATDVDPPGRRISSAAQYLLLQRGMRSCTSD